jgi:peptide/nickel transport system permease protein
MTGHVLKRIAWMIPSFLGITFVVFAIIKAAPGDPLSMQGDTLKASATSAATIAEYRRLMGFDDPLFIGYGKWLWKMIHLDLGTSFRDGRPVATKLAEALPVTLLLASLSLFLTYLVAIPVGIYSAVKPGTAGDRASTVGLFLLYSMPSQWVAMLLIVTLGTAWNLLPIQGLHSEGIDTFADRALHLVLPLFCLTYASFASLSRYMRTGMLEVIRQDYIRTARAKGLSERVVVFRHALRNALLSIVTLLGLTLPALVGGAVIVERIFGLPGMGHLAFEAIITRDVPVLMGDTALAGMLTMVGLLVSDLLYAAVDPRIKVGGS